MDIFALREAWMRIYFFSDSWIYIFTSSGTVFRFCRDCAAVRPDFRSSLVSGLRSSPLFEEGARAPPPSGEERGLISRTAAGNRAYTAVRDIKRCIIYQFGKCNSWLCQGTVFEHRPKYKLKLHKPDTDELQLRAYVNKTVNHFTLLKCKCKSARLMWQNLNSF